MVTEQQKKQEYWVMVVDDDEALLRSTGMLLEEEGLKVVLCSCGKEALDKFDEKIHAVILDITLPDIQGSVVFEKLKEKNPWVPVILHTGLSNRREKINARKTLRPHAYILKGGGIEELIDTVLSAVQSYSNYLEATMLKATLEKHEKENISLREKLKVSASKRYTPEPQDEGNPPQAE